MKTITFNYTKADGTTSERTLVATVSPADFYAGIDVSSIDPIRAAEFAREYQEALDQHLKAVKDLQAKFDLKHNYRKFLTAGISELTEI